MKDTLVEDFNAFVDYHFHPIGEKRFNQQRILVCILWLIQRLHGECWDKHHRALDAAEDLFKSVRCYAHQEWGVACNRCGGAGTYSYGSGSTWRGGMGVASITEDVCDVCWGTGRTDKTGLNLRELVEKAREVKP